MRGFLVRKLKIAIVLNRFVPSSGGVSYFSFLADELSKRGHEVYIFASEAEKTNCCNYKIVLVPVIKKPKILRAISFILATGWMLRRYKFDIVHQVDEGLKMNVFNPHGGVEKAYLKQEFNSIDSRIYRLIRKVKRYLSPYHYFLMWLQKRQFQNKNVKKIIAISRMVQNDVMKYYGVPKEKIAYVFNTCDLKRFCPENRDRFFLDVRKELKIPPCALVLMFAGHNFRLKGLKPLLLALKELCDENKDREIYLLVAGRGRIRTYIRLAKKLNIEKRVVFLGPVKDIEKYYAASDIYIHPTYYDSCSLTVLEALASGLPVITTKFNGAKDAILSDEGGIVIDDPSDVLALKAAIAHFFDENRRANARIITRKWMEKFSPEKNVEETLRVYYEVLSEK